MTTKTNRRRAKRKMRLAMLLLLSVWLQCSAFTFFPVTKRVLGCTPPAIANTDTSFTPEEQAGWGSWMTYLQRDGDSINVELVLVNHHSDFNPALPSVIGTLSASFRPLARQIIDYAEPERTWRVTLLETGQCVLKLLNGPPPAGHPMVVPLKLRFRKEN